MEKEVKVFDGFYVKRSRKVMDKYQIILTFDDIFLVNSGNDYSQFMKSLFSGIGELAGMVGGAVGVLGEVLSTFSEKKSTKNLEKLLSNLEKYAATREDTEKIDFSDLQAIHVKKGSLFTGRSYIEFVLQEKKIKLTTEKKEQIDDFLLAVEMHPFSIFVKEKWF